MGTFSPEDKRKVRCYKGYAVAGNTYNLEVYVTYPGFGYSSKLFTCSRCGEIFVITGESIPSDLKLHIECGLQCPTCESSLGTTLLEYPANIVTPTGAVATVKSITRAPNQDEGVVLEFWDLTKFVD